jgi:cell division septation protein DedD
VAVCGVFFSLGFLVGYNERASRMAPVTEHVSNPAVTPPVVNPPPESPQMVPPPSASAEPPRPIRQPTEAESKSSGAQAASSPPSPSSAAAPGPGGLESQAEPVPSAVPPSNAGEVGVGFTVQVAASRAKEDAEALVKILKERGYPVFLVAPEYAHANDNLFRVQVGPFRTRDDAEKVRKQLAAEGFNPFVRH